MSSPCARSQLGRLPRLWEWQQDWERQQEPSRTRFGSHSPRPAEGKSGMTPAVLLSRADFALSCPQSLLNQSWHFYVDSGLHLCHRSVRFCTCFHRSITESPNTGVFHLMEMKLSCLWCSCSSGEAGVAALGQDQPWLSLLKPLSSGQALRRGTGWAGALPLMERDFPSH